MATQRRNYYLIVLGQAMCVAVGLLMHYRLLEASASNTVETALWSELEVAAEHWLHEIESADPDPRDSETDDATGAWASVEHEQPRRCHITIVDRNWRTVQQQLAGGHVHAVPLKVGEPVSWTPQLPGRPSVVGPTRGTFDMPGGPQLVIARALRDGTGFLLVHRPAADVDTAVAPLVDALVPVGAVALLWTVALLSITVHLILMRQRETLDRERTRSSTDVLRQTQLLIRTRDALIFSLAKLAGFRDDETGNHLERISAYSVELASALHSNPRFSSQVTPAFVRVIGLSSILHDIGKVGIEDSVLRKPGKLTPEERECMQRHTSIAGRCLQEIAQSLGSSNFLEMARDVAVAHHERWDGSGYPNGLQGEAIPLSARIVAIADVYDALATRRVYKDILPHEQCVEIIREGRGTQFDPNLVDVWLTIEQQFRGIANQYASAPVQLTSVETDASRGEAGEPEQGSPAEPSVAADDGQPEVPAESSAAL